MLVTVSLTLFAAVAIAAVAGCADSADRSTPSASTTMDAPSTVAPTVAVAVTPPIVNTILLVWRGPAGASMEARVSGKLGISGAGCVTVADLVLVAPPGSTIDGDRVHLVSIADAVIGDRIQASGGLVDVESLPGALRPLGYERCGATEFAVVSAP